MSGILASPGLVQEESLIWLPHPNGTKVGQIVSVKVQCGTDAYLDESGHGELSEAKVSQIFEEKLPLFLPLLSIAEEETSHVALAVWIPGISQSKANVWRDGESGLLIRKAEAKPLH